MAETLPQFLFEHAQKTPDKVALRERDYGIWQSITWQQYAGHVKYFALGLVSMGLVPEETIAIIGDNRPEWVMSELAAQAVGAKAVGLYQDSVPPGFGGRSSAGPLAWFGFPTASPVRRCLRQAHPATRIALFRSAEDAHLG